MSLAVPNSTLAATKLAELAIYRDSLFHRDRDGETTVNTEKLSEKGFAELIKVAQKAGDPRTCRALAALQLARKGVFDKKVPNFKAFAGMLKAFLAKNMIDGWIYVEGADGKLYPELVTRVAYNAGYQQEQPSVVITTASYSLTGYSSNVTVGPSLNKHNFFASMVTNKRVVDALAAHGIYKETPELRQEYDRSIARFHEVVHGRFAQQFRLSGSLLRREERGLRDSVTLFDRKVIHDLRSDEYRSRNAYEESYLFEANEATNGAGAVPEHPIVRVFDLRSHESYWVHSDYLEPYVYDQSLRDKLVLPEAHRDLLDILTTDLGAFVDDIIEGKSAGNIILCRGIPGVGKTLTAEVYAELIERPLYAIHAGVLGVSAADIAKNLQAIFDRVKRWDCVLLLDEADVFVVRRGDSVEQNAIVAEFLRSLEYFDGLMFMTTNRPDDIDEAIVSRCAAIIRYEPPTPGHARQIWRVMGQQFEAELSDELIGELITLFPSIAPRDIKMLLRLALRVSTAKGEPLSVDVFRRCAMFRDVAMADNAP